ncbi:MAG: ATP-binding protein [Candidatus Zixiibacteriota bacterium]
MSKPIRVLLVEDSENDVSLLLRELRRSGYEPEYVRVEQAEEMNRELHSRNWDAIISDYTMPGFSGMDALTILKDSGLDIPFMIVSGSIGEDRAVEVMRAGAKDYIMKGNLRRLTAAIEREIGEAKERANHRHVEEQLRMSERMRSVGEVASTIIHDLKNPMQIVLSSAEFLYSFDLSKDERDSYFESIQRQVERILAMMQEILDFARGELKLVPESVELSELCREIDDTFKQSLAKDRVNFAIEQFIEDNGPQQIVIDRLKIWRALSNLIINAKDAMPNGGDIRLRLIAQSDQVIFKVEDNGQGIPESIRDTIFNPFVTHGKSRGTGLGLAIVRDIVQAHSGTIEFITDATGTTFSISLPRKTIPALAISGQHTAASSHR